ncbi:HAD family hydrolase [Mucilaginibacter pocheonensis]|uniref:HAD superfamily hydrolase (TIGR01509 family) n=1 Tax=Mucilaginibacter pocheonensis TaxID=398050 RepID=A0ABU1TFX9_9SPHI|nr:HAD family phosphatase [Mucilaginibacter pocheonensis]MDR6943741.1 HAD superfamily hydrolase (TIGR01509 family) [Mucilaginibacter pocheonensis]
MISSSNTFIFDMNGTMVNDMHYHELAWYNILVNELGAKLTQEQVKHQLYGKNEELFARVFGPDWYTDEEIDAITQRKEALYRKEFLPELKLIDGLDDFLRIAYTLQIPLAIGTAAIPSNVDFVLDNLDIRRYFPIVIGPDDVKLSKPDPEVFLKAASDLGVLSENCIVFEDSPKGIEAARRAGMKAIGVASYHTPKELENSNVIAIINDYYDPFLSRLFLDY